MPAPKAPTSLIVFALLGKQIVGGILEGAVKG